MQQRRKAIPSGKKDAEKNGFGKESKTFEGKRHANDGAGFPHEPRPQQSKLERKDRARDCADGEENGRASCPPFGELEINWSSGAEMQSLRDCHEHGQPDAHRCKDNVETKRHAHLRTGKEKITHPTTVEISSFVTGKTRTIRPLFRFSLITFLRGVTLASRIRTNGINKAQPMRRRFSCRCVIRGK